ncbi:MAG: RagB/SusD family nutrient uptake outer membrane protein, partial [Bacteroidales bacterium]|nr:RagB/SusD family nutrient uptake outer membrane protein [Bacteroidales bacterium]
MKIRYLKQIYTTGLILLMSFYGCKESYLEIPPFGTAFEKNMATETGLNSLLIGAYRSLQMSSSIWGNVSNMTFSGFATNEFVRGAPSFPHLANFESHRIDALSVNWLSHARWAQCYSGIQRANSVLNVLKNVPEGKLSAKKIAQIQGEAVFLRAVLHFELAKVYLNVPYVDESITFSDGNYNVPNTESIWPKIEKDFKFAIDNLSETIAERGRANSWAAKCFLAKVYMQQHKYTEALPLLTDAIENGVTAGGQKYALNPLFFDNFDAKKKNSAESVFAVQFAVFDDANSGNENQGMCVAIPQVPGCEGSGFVGITRATINTFKTDQETGLPLFETYNDFDLPDNAYISDNEPFTSYQGTLDSRLDNSIMRRGVPLLDWGMPKSAWSWNKVLQSPYGMRKYLHYQADRDVLTRSIGWTYFSSINYDMIRFADVLLLAAECEV